VDITAIKTQKKKTVIFYFAFEAVPLDLNILKFSFPAKSSLFGDQIL
jgi:hypothetical protein